MKRGIIIDDLPEKLEVLAELVKKANLGLHIQTGTNLDEGFKLIRTRINELDGIGLAVFDYSLTGSTVVDYRQTGLALIDELQKLHTKAIVFLVTGASDEEYRVLERETRRRGGIPFQYEKPEFLNKFRSNLQMYGEGKLERSA